MTINDRIKKIFKREATIGVVGLGYVGFPLALSLADAGFKIIGVDIDKKRVDGFNRGKLIFGESEPGLQELLHKVNKSDKCKFSTQYDELENCDAIVISVQTPLQKDKFVPDYRILKSAVESVARIIPHNSLLVVQSTIAPGTSKSIIRPIVEKISKKTLGKNLFYAYVPERIMPGRTLDTLKNMPRIIGADNEISRKAATALYKYVTNADIDSASVISAEISKTAENSYRFIEINFANALALLCEEYGASYNDVRRLANKHENIKLLWPGVGIGGHCIPKDPWLLVWNKRRNLMGNLFNSGKKINQTMPIHTIDLIKLGLKKIDVKVKDAEIAVLGVSYREGSDDVRSSPASAVISLLIKMGAKLEIHDSEIPEYCNKNLIEVLKDKHAVVVLTAHDEYRKFSLNKLKGLLKFPLIIDGRQTWDRQEAIKLGFTYLQIGEPHE